MFELGIYTLYLNLFIKIGAKSSPHAFTTWRKHFIPYIDLHRPVPTFAIRPSTSMNPLLRKRSINSKDLWLSDLSSGCTVENPEITNETASATLCLGSIKSPLSGSFSIDYLCKYIAISPRKDFFSDDEENSTDSESPSFSPDATFIRSNESDISLPSFQSDDSPLPGAVFFGNDTSSTGYISFPRIEESPYGVPEKNEKSFNRSIIGSISGTLRRRSASV
ncbi:hypothetical protein K7432_010647 [Basidiobolus ranarum]|uniref:Uncharacterized protein n=1 Tax=Basidiobolus ranarum TaxID=34480 RepID=A0ABR2WNF0_9FUNG